MLSPNDALHVPLIFSFGNEVHPATMLAAAIARIMHADFIRILSANGTVQRRGFPRTLQPMVRCFLFSIVFNNSVINYNGICSSP